MGRFDHRPEKNSRDRDLYRPQPIFGDPDLGYYDDPPPPRADDQLDTTGWVYKKLPKDYWPNYDLLAAEARAIPHLTGATIVCRQDGTYHVLAHDKATWKKVTSTPADDRLAAWRNFIAENSTPPVATAKKKTNGGGRKERGRA